MFIWMFVLAVAIGVAAIFAGWCWTGVGALSVAYMFALLAWAVS